MGKAGIGKNISRTIGCFAAVGHAGRNQDEPSLVSRLIGVSGSFFGINRPGKMDLGEREKIWLKKFLGIDRG